MLDGTVDGIVNTASVNISVHQAIPTMSIAAGFRGAGGVLSTFTRTLWIPGKAGWFLTLPSM
jgi:hypothetical protein